MAQDPWTTTPISQLYLGLYDGPHATPPPAADGPVFLGIKNVTDDGHLDLTDIRHIAEADFGAWTHRVEPRPGDLVFTYEATLNRYAIIPDGFRGCLGRRMALIRPNPARVDTRWLHYYFFSPAWRDVVRRNTLAGSTVDRLPLTRFPEFPVRSPPLPTQRRIAGILSAYDDLVANCERRIRVLDEMARALYREWFMHFRYPGHEKVPLVDSALGRIPKGWRVATLSSVTSFLSRGISPSYDDEGTSTVINQKCVRDQRLDMSPARRQSKPFPEERRVRAGDILVNSTGVGTLGRVAQVLEDLGTCTADTHVTIIRADDATDSAFLGAALLALQPTFERKGVGATGQTELSRTAIGEVAIALPPTERQRAFAEVARPIRSESLNLQKQASNLRRTRDLLLPRLLSGQLSVEDA
jgi:type I restriction enzyme S subunit